MDAADANRKPVGGDDMDTLETACGKRERAPVDRAMDPQTRTQSLGKKCRVGDLHLAFVAEKKVVKEHVHWRHFKGKG